MENELQIESHAYSIYRPSDGIQLSPFVRHHNSQFSIPTRQEPPAVGVSILNYYISTLEKGVGQIRLLFLHCEGKSAALSLEGLTVGRVVDSAQKSTRYSSRDYSIVGKNLYLIFTVWP